MINHLKGCREVKLRAKERPWELPISECVVAFITAVSVELQRSHCNDVEWTGGEDIT